MFEKNTPRDFFLHAGAFISLYFGAIALLTLLFGLINYAYRDIVFAGTYYDPYSGPMRFAIASLIILVPLTVFLFHVIQRETRANPERRSFGVRRWLTYITLFIAGATVVGDLIVLLTTFMGGTLLTPFLLKVLSMLAIVGIGLWYFVLDIKGYWAAHAEHSRYLTLSIAGAVLVAVVGGMTLVGSPTKQRDFRLDAQEVYDLTFIQNGVISYWQQSGTLPNSIDDLSRSFLTDFPTGIEGYPAYTYEKRGDLTFALCATFARASDESVERVEPSLDANSTWTHEAGYQCFERTIDPAVMQSAKPPIR